MKVIIAEVGGEFEVNLRDSSRDCDTFTIRTFDNEAAALAFAYELSRYTGIDFPALGDYLTSIFVEPTPY